MIIVGKTPKDSIKILSVNNILFEIQRITSQKKGISHGAHGAITRDDCGSDEGREFEYQCGNCVQEGLFHGNLFSQFLISKRY